MPLVRCMHFDDDGNPYNSRGCPKGGDCEFVHPSHADWASAPISRRKVSWITSKNDSRGGPSRSFSGVGMRHLPPNTTDNISIWGASGTADNTSTWGASSGDTSGGAWSQPNSSWGTGSGWGNNSESGGGWGASSWSSGGGAATGSTTKGGWGSPQDSGPSGSSGWGSSSQVPSWGPPFEAGQVAQDKGKGKEKAAKDIVMRDSSPPRRRASPPRQDRQNQFKKPDLPAMRTDPQLPESPSQSPISSVSTSRPVGAVPLPTRQRQGTIRPSPAQESLQKRALELAATKTARETGKVYPHEGSSTESPVPASTKNYDGPKGRLLLFADLITHMQDLIISEIFLRRANTEDEQWKRTQVSEIYAHASPLTRSALDAHRQGYKDKVGAATKNRDNALQALLDLPDFAPRGKVKDPEVTTEIVANYTAELREWLMGLHLHKRLLVEQRAKEESKTLEQKAASEPTPASPTCSTTPTASELFQRGNWTWKELKDAVTILEQQMDATSEQVYSGICISFPPSDIDQQIAEKAAEIQLDSLESTVDASTQRFEDLQQGVSQAGDDLRAQAERAALLFNKLHDLQAEIATLGAEKIKMDEVCAQADKQFQMFDESNKAQEAEIEELSRQLQTLHLRKRPSLVPPPHSATPPPAPVKVDEILEYIRPIILQKMEADIVPFFMTMRQRVSENQADVAKELEQLVKPVVEMTEEICQKVMSMNVAQASALVSG
ncbi:hypothetical protein CPB84DRAFT_1764615 [Gymnopilus junonius]|uniref:C3H1-type domain-containing protein n=1 Tax=Gymnopilus junonius TaxID=109634 RepID=A0A9P5TSU4_GYMJU|nr:hypothetical protein CPB84DRAFT_1764615 [Gymnopilus junonius]